MTNPLTAYDHLLSRSEDALRATYPFGAVKVKGRWQPAEKGKHEKTLRQLLADKKKRRAKTKLLKPGFGYVEVDWDEVPRHSFGKQHRHAGEFGEPELEVVDDETQERFSKEARNRRAIVHAEEQRRAEVRSYLARLRQLAIEQIKAGGDPNPMLSAVVAQFERKGGKKAA